jgi:hypothetical protein
MMAKQQYFTNQHTLCVENSHILNLDVKVDSMTLRRYLMSRAPHTEVLQRLFVAIDKSWKGETYTLITVQPCAAEATRALNNMIPECVHEYGIEAAKKWFTNICLEAYRQVKWDPSKRSTTSQQDRETRALVEEDLFGIGTNWKIEAPIMKTKSE